MGIPVEGLQDEIDRFNTFPDLNKDLDFGKPAPFYRIQKPPFYAAKLLMLAHDQMGGLRANTKGQVIELTSQVASDAVSIDERAGDPAPVRRG